MIQRIQTVYLLLGAVLMSVFAFMTPAVFMAGNEELCHLGVINNTLGADSPNWVLLTMNILIVVLAFIAIFSFKKLKKQQTLCLVCALLTVAITFTVLLTAFYQAPDGTEASFSASIVLPTLACVAFLLATMGVKHDRKLLSDSSRIR